MVAPNNTQLSQHTRLDEVQAALAALPQQEVPVQHRFTPGVYTREVFMPAGIRIVSKIHKTRHQFIISEGAALVRDKDGPWVLFTAFYHGVTEPGTRRELFVVNDCRWTTIHPGPWQTVEEAEKDIIEPHQNNLLTEASP